MKNFERGDIYLANLPSTKFANNIPAPSPIVGGARFVVLLHNSDDLNYDERQVLIAPLIKIEELDNTTSLLPTYIELPEDSYDFLDENNFIATHQVMPINRDWLKDDAIGNISGTEYGYKMDLGVITSAGLWSLIEEYIKSEATKQRIQYIGKVKNAVGTYNPASISSRQFLRGDVFYSQLPQQEFDNGSFSPSYTLQGEHMVVALHDSTSKEFDDKQVLVAPITSAKAAVTNNNLLPTHVPLLPTESRFIKKKSFVSTHQIMPLNREWLDEQKKGKLESAKMLEIDLAIILSGSLYPTVQKEKDKRLEELRKEALKKIQSNDEDTDN